MFIVSFQIVKPSVNELLSKKPITYFLFLFQILFFCQTVWTREHTVSPQNSDFRTGLQMCPMRTKITTSPANQTDIDVFL